MTVELDDLCNHVHVMMYGAVQMVKTGAQARSSFSIRSPELLNVLVQIRCSRRGKGGFEEPLHSWPRSTQFQFSLCSIKCRQKWSERELTGVCLWAGGGRGRTCFSSVSQPMWAAERTDPPDGVTSCGDVGREFLIALLVCWLFLCCGYKIGSFFFFSTSGLCDAYVCSVSLVC